jgi:hypothetical protein
MAPQINRVMAPQINRAPGLAPGNDPVFMDYGPPRGILCDSGVLKALITCVVVATLLTVALAFAVINLKATQATSAKVIVGCLAPVAAATVLVTLVFTTVIGVLDCRGKK